MCLLCSEGLSLEILSCHRRKHRRYALLDAPVLLGERFVFQGRDAIAVVAEVLVAFVRLQAPDPPALGYLGGLVFLLGLLLRTVACPRVRHL